MLRSDCKGVVRISCRRWAVLVATSLFIVYAQAVRAAYDDISQSVIATGGGTSVNGVLAVTGTIAQPVVGASGNANYALSGGFWLGGAPTGEVNIKVNVAIAGSGSGAVASDPASITCPGTCSGTFSGVPSVTLVATPGNAASIFTGWLGACTGRGSCRITTAGTASVTAVFAPNSIYSSRLDIDENGSYDALTDGLLAIRYLFGLTGSALTAGAVGAGAALNDPLQVQQHLDDIKPLLDIDGNGQADALTDGLMLIRYLFGLRGDSLIGSTIGTGATRTTAAQIEGYIQSLLP